MTATAYSTDIQIRARQNLDTLQVHLSIEEQVWLRHKKKLVVGILNRNLPPYQMINERQELEGIGADYLSALQLELGVPVQLQTFPSPAAAYKALKTGQVDLVDSATQIEAEDYQVTLSPPYAFTELALFAESGDLRDYARNMPSTRVAANDGMALELYQRTSGQGRIQRYPSPLAAMASVLNGEADVYLGDTFATYYVSNQVFSNQLVVNHSAGLPEIQVGFAIAPDNLLLQSILQRTLGNLKRCQVVSALAKWGSTESCDLSSFRERLAVPERIWLDQAKPLRLVISEDLAPYAFFNSRGRFNGIASDVLDIVRRKTGLRFEIIRVTSQGDADAQLRNHQADLSVLTQVDPEHPAYLFTRPFVTTPYVLLRKKDTAHIELNEGSSGSLVFASGQLLSGDLARSYPHLRLEETRTIAEALNRVRDGQVDFTIAPANLAHYYLTYKYENSVEISGMLAIPDARITFVAPKEQALLVSIMDKALAEVPPQEYLKIIGRWRANSATDDKYWEGVASFIWKSLGILCLLLAVAGYWIFTQRRRIIRKRQDLLQRQLLLDQVQLAKESAEKASRSKSVFLTTMSHEIRTPLNAIIGMLELVLTRKDNAELNTQSVHIAYESAHTLLALIGDILDISRIESGRLTLRPEPASLQELIGAVANVFKGLARQKNLSLHLKLDDLARQPVWIDALKFKQILSNLVSNAIKFTDQGSVLILCQAKPAKDGSINVSVSVTDTGAGIAPSQIRQVFSPFFELDSAVNNSNTGAGLGLSISQSLSRLMSGRLSVESEVGVGTRMLFTARFERVSEKSRDQAGPKQPSATPDIDLPLTVLIVEDHLPSQYLLNQQINYLGHQVITANNGVEGLAQWQAHDIDIILTDCNMSEMNGNDMTRAIRRLETQAGLRPCTIIGLTASAQQEDLERCLSSGMSHALTKPINLAGLNRVIPKLQHSGKANESVGASLNEDIQSALAERVISSNRQELLALCTAREQNNRPAFGAIAHKLKGTAYLLNAQDLLELCQNLEELIAEDAHQQALHSAVTALEEALLTLNESLQPL
ncbi:transporter substrate-binding domain-containing protein [Pseudomonas sp. ADAK18]|nr:transporter substrate-binding domain-containing protein [Pseudomonas sp. ADAK18]